MLLPDVIAGPSHREPSISFRDPVEDQMSIAASEKGLLCSGNEDDAEVPTVMVYANAESELNLTAMLSWVKPDVHGKLGSMELF